MSQERVRVAVVGAGIVGLTLAIALSVFDESSRITIDLYEASPELSEIGAGINIWPRTWQVLKGIGMAHTLIPLFDHFPDLEPRVAYEIRKADQRNGFKVMDVIKNGGVLRIHRGEFQRSLIKHLPPAASNKCNLHLSHRLIDYTESPTDVTLHFANGTSASCDVLVGADGIKSTMRRLFLSRLPDPGKYRTCLEPVWSGTVAYRGLVSREALAKEFPDHRALNHPGIMYVGKNKHTVVYPVSGGKFINVVAAVHDSSKDGTIWDGPWNTDVSQQEMLDSFIGWDEEYQALLRCIKQPTKWTLQKVNPPDVFARERVFLIGDSVHAMVPFQAAGAGVGIEDAYILATLLTCPSSTSTNMHKASQIYNNIRVPRATSLLAASEKQGHLVSLDTPGFEGFREGEEVPREMLLELFNDVQRNWDWTTSDPEDDRQKAAKAML